MSRLVRGEGGDVTRTASLAHKMFEIHTSLAEQQALPEKMVHVMCHADSFRLQQGSVLAGICRELHFSHKTFPTQVCIFVCIYNVCMHVCVYSVVVVDTVVFKVCVIECLGFKFDKCTITLPVKARLFGLGECENENILTVTTHTHLHYIHTHTYAHSTTSSALVWR